MKQKNISLLPEKRCYQYQDTGVETKHKCEVLLGSPCKEFCCSECKDEDCNSRCSNSVQPGKSSCDKDPDRNNENKLVVINGLAVIQFLDSEYGIEHLTWENSCISIRKSFRKKTSISRKNGKEYETVRWYQVMDNGSMKSTGSAEEPDYINFYYPEPKPRYGFMVWVPESPLQSPEHIVIEEKDYLENLKLFEKCLVFKLADCQNRIHPMYKNPNKYLSVRVPIAAGDLRKDRKDLAEDPEFPDDEEMDDGGIF